MTAAGPGSESAGDARTPAPGPSARSASNALEGARVLADLLDRFEDVPTATRRLKDVERIGDGLAQAVFQALNHSYLTPIDREDIGPLASALDDVMDDIKAVGRRIALYHITASN